MEWQTFTFRMEHESHAFRSRPLASAAGPCDPLLACSKGSDRSLSVIWLGTLYSACVTGMYPCGGMYCCGNEGPAQTLWGLTLGSMVVL